MKKRMDLRLFDLDANLIDRSGAESLIPEQYAREIIQGVVSESAVLRMGRRLPNMSSNKYRMPVLDMLPMAYFVNGDNGQKKTTKMSWIRNTSLRKRLQSSYRSRKQFWKTQTTISGAR